MFVGALTAATSMVVAAEEAGLKAKVDALVQPLMESGIPVGFVVGIIDHGQRYIFGYGKLSRDADKTPDGRSIFEIGSVTKVFTGLLLADMVERKLLKLDDPVREFLPQTVTVPRWDGQVITLLDLATQTSGLPRMPGNFSIAAVKDPRNPYANYTVEQLYEFLSHHSLSQKPGTQFEYSNLGVGLLGHALGRRADTSYESLVVEGICAPLGMKDTCITLSEEQRSRLAQGHGPLGRPVANWDIRTFAGAGALRSTVNDMLKFITANLGLKKSRLSAAIELSHLPRHDTDRPGGKIALCWHIRSDKTILWHNGQTGGYHSMLALQKQRKIGVVVLSNTAHRIVDELAMAVMAILSGEPAKPLNVDLPEGQRRGGTGAQNEGGWAATPSGLSQAVCGRFFFPHQTTFISHPMVVCHCPRWLAKACILDESD